jgi:hypothetical protein
MLQDLRYALRTFRDRPGVTAVAVVSLALGLAAAASAVSLLDALGFRPLAVADPDTLVQVRSLYNEGGSGGQLSYLDFQDLKDGAHAFSALTYYTVRGVGLSGQEAAPEVVLINAVSQDYFQTLGVSPLFGRPFQALDVAAEGPTTVVLSQRLCSGVSSAIRPFLAARSG